MRSLRSITLRLAWWILGAVLLVGIAGQAGRVSDKADALNFLAPIWLSGGLIAALWILFAATGLRSRMMAGGAAAMLGAITWTLAATDRLPAPPADCPAEKLTLVQFNILKDNADIRPAIAWIKGTGADLVTIEEAAGELPVVAALRPDYPHAVSCVAGMHCSTMILSRRPFIASGGLARGDPENRKGLSAAWATIASRDGPFTVVAAHLDRPWPWHSRPADMAELAAFVRDRGGDTTLVAGDFNRPAWTFQLRRVTAALGLARAPDIRSWPASRIAPPLLAIDHVFFGRRWTVDRIDRGPWLGSDHFPLLARLRLSSAQCAGSQGLTRDR
jgi:endonuclease/exonuclease/phosphatase (EEP) superfamily protein YafD